MATGKRRGSAASLDTAAAAVPPKLNKRQRATLRGEQLNESNRRKAAAKASAAAAPPAPPALDPPSTGPTTRRTRATASGPEKQAAATPIVKTRAAPHCQKCGQPMRGHGKAPCVAVLAAEARQHGLADESDIAAQQLLESLTPPKTPSPTPAAPLQSSPTTRPTEALLLLSPPPSQSPPTDDDMDEIDPALFYTPSIADSQLPEDDMDIDLDLGETGDGAKPTRPSSPLFSDLDDNDSHLHEEEALALAAAAGAAQGATSPTLPASGGAPKPKKQGTRTKQSADPPATEKKQRQRRPAEDKVPDEQKRAYDYTVIFKPTAKPKGNEVCKGFVGTQLRTSQ